MSVLASLTTHVGRVRQQNEDTVAGPGLMSIGTLAPPLSLVCHPESGPLLFCIVDGMGGHRGGERASRIVAEHLVTDITAHLIEKLEVANKRLYEEMERSPDLSAMGATVAGVILEERQATVFNVGDARVYHLSDGYMTLVSHDDRVAGESELVLQSLGGTDRPVAIEPHITSFDVELGDKLLICSDGLSDVLPFETIQAKLSQLSAADATDALLTSCLNEGAPDNVSVIVLQVDAAMEAAAETVGGGAPL